MTIHASDLTPLSPAARIELYRAARDGFAVAAVHDRPVCRPNVFNSPPDVVVGTSVEFADWTVAAIMAGVHDANVVAGRFIARTSDTDGQSRIEAAIALRRQELVG